MEATYFFDPVQCSPPTRFAGIARMGICLAPLSLMPGGRGNMAEPQINLDPASLNPVEQKLRGPLEDQLTSALQAAIEKITEGYAGESVDRVTAMLLAQTKAGLHPDIAAGFSPDPTELRRVAKEIVQAAH
jgi:hypothetical protein